jgi:hypothetical protein
MTEGSGGFVPPLWAEMVENSFRSMLGVGPDTRTPEQKERARAEFAAESARIRVTVMAEHAVRVVGATGLQRQVLELHAPVFYGAGRDAHCGGCDFGGWEAEAPDFPCRTYELANQ